MCQSTAALPRWDLKPLFPGLESQEYLSAVANLSTLLDGLEASLNDPGKRPEDLGRVVERLNEVLALAKLVRAYVSALVTTDSSDNLALARQSELSGPLTRLAKAEAVFTDWVGTLGLDSLLDRPGVCADHAFALRDAQFRASRQMTLPEEALAADLYDTGSGAWSRLHSRLSSSLTVSLRSEGLPMSVVRLRAYDPDPAVRTD